MVFSGSGVVYHCVLSFQKVHSKREETSSSRNDAQKTHAIPPDYFMVLTSSRNFSPATNTKLLVLDLRMKLKQAKNRQKIF